MIDIQEIKLLMAGRAGVYGLLADAFSFPMDFENVYNFLKYLYDLTESVEVVDADEEILQGFKGLANWYHKIEGEKVELSWVDGKLREEFNEVFKNPQGSIGIIFPNTENILSIYEENGYKPEYAPGGINEMFSFLSHMAIETAKKDTVEEISPLTKIQEKFIREQILPYVSSFCEALYELAPSYGIYQYIAIVVHGFIMLDLPTLNYF